MFRKVTERLGKSPIFNYNIFLKSWHVLFKKKSSQPQKLRTAPYVQRQTRRCFPFVKCNSLHCGCNRSNYLLFFYYKHKQQKKRKNDIAHFTPLIHPSIYPSIHLSSHSSMLFKYKAHSSHSIWLCNEVIIGIKCVYTPSQTFYYCKA